MQTELEKVRELSKQVKLQEKDLQDGIGVDIRMVLEEIGIIAGNWVDSAQDTNYWRALVNAALNLRVL